MTEVHLEALSLEVVEVGPPLKAFSSVDDYDPFCPCRPGRLQRLDRDGPGRRMLKLMAPTVDDANKGEVAVDPLAPCSDDADDAAAHADDPPSWGYTTGPCGGRWPRGHCHAAARLRRGAGRDGSVSIFSSAGRQTRSLFPRRRVGIFPSLASRNARPREMPSRAPASSTLSVATLLSIVLMPQGNRI